MLESLSHLAKASAAGDQFRDTLAQTDGLSRTKWLDTLNRAVKPLVLAVTVAAGATGCSTMANQSPLTESPNKFDQATVTALPATSYESLMVEAAELNEMPREQLAEVIRDREQVNNFSSLERITPLDLADQIVNAGGDTTGVLSNPLAIDNPFQPGKLVKVSNNKDWGANWDMAVNEGVGLSYMLDARSTNNPYAINTNNLPGNANSLHSGSAGGSTIVLPAEMTKTSWPSSTTDPARSSEAIASVIFHELAHNHFMQEVTKYGGANPNNTGVLDAHHDTYRVLTEVGANLTGAMATFKAFDIPAEKFLRTLNAATAIQDRNVMGTGFDGKLGEPSITDYRASRSYDVLAELIERDPEAMKNLSYEAMSIVAYDITQKAGYFYNAAEMIDLKHLQDFDPEMRSRSAISKDKGLMSMIAQTLPEDSDSFQAADELKETWQLYQSREALEGLSGSLAAFAVFSDHNVSSRELDRANEGSHLISEYPDAQHTIQSVVERLQVTGGKGLTADQAVKIKTKYDQALEGIPSYEDLAQQRIDLIQTIQGEINTNLQMAEQSDPAFKVAQGSGQTSEQIATDIQAMYGDSVWYNNANTDQVAQVTVNGNPEYISADLDYDDFGESGSAPGM